MTKVIHRGMVAALALSVVAGCGDSVLPPEPEVVPVRYHLRVDGDADRVVAPQEFVVVELVVDRDPDFTDPIDFEADFPPGMAAVFRPPRIVGRPGTQLILVPSAAIERTTHHIKVMARAAGAAPQMVTLTLTVADG